MTANNHRIPKCAGGNVVCMRVGKRAEFRGAILLVAAAALTLGCVLAEASWKSEATDQASSQTSAPPPIPRAGPSAKPNSFIQVAVPFKATSTPVPADNPQTPGKIALGAKLFFDGRLSADG